MVNPLVAEAKDETKAYSGMPLLEAGADLKKAIESGDWASVALGAVGTGLEVLGMALDPFAAILANGVGWLIEHVGPLKEALDGLAGDPEEIKAHSETWKNVAAELGAIGQDLAGMSTGDTASWQGVAADTYRQRTTDTVNLITAAQQGADGASSGIKTAGEVVAAVRALVRDIIADLVGSLISWALQVVFTLGIGLAWVVPKVVAKVAQVASQIASLIKKTVQALKNLVPLLKKAGDLFDDAAKALKNIKPSKADTPSKPGGDTPKSIDGPPNPKGGDSTSPSGANSKPDTSPPPPRTEPKPEPKPGDSTSPSGATPGPRPETTPRSGDTSRSRGGDSLRDQGPNPRSMDNTRCVGDPIDVSTGQMVMHEVDAEFLGTLPMVFERAHFSSYRAGRWFGAVWMSTLDQRLEVHDDQVIFASADGTIQVFPRPRDDEWVAAERGPARLLSAAPGGGFVLEDRERARLLFFAPGAGVLPVESISDRNGNHIVFERDEQGVPTEVWHSGGYRVRVTTDNGLVTALSSVAGDSVVELVRYGYTDGRLTEVTNASGLPFRYSYDELGRIVAWADRNEEWYRYVYDDAGRVVRTEGAGGALTGTMEYEHLVTHATDSLGHRTTFHMNEFGQVVREVDPLGGVIVSEWDARDRLVAETDQLGRRTSYRHDEAGNVVAVVRPDGAETLVERNELGLPTRLVEASGVETRWEYDERGNLTRVVEPDGATTVYTHDEWGHLASVTDPAGMTLTVVSDASGLPVTVTDPRGAVTTYEHDRFGRLVAVTDPMGAVERFGYTVEGALSWHRRADGTTEQWLFDGEGNSRVYTNAAAAVTRAEVTHFDLPSAQVHSDGSRVEFTYDTELRLVAVTNEQRQVWRYEYDAVGNVVRETDFGGATMDYRFDLAGQLTEVRNGAGQTVSLTRDVLGNVVEEVTSAARVRYTYSDVGHLLVMDDGTTRVEYARDPVGRVLAETVNGRTVHSEYDRAGRRTRRRTPSGAESVWEYDEAGNPAAVHTAGRSMRFEYDLAGRETRRTFGSGTTIVHSWTPTGLVAGQMVVSAAGQLGQERTYGYRPDGLPVRVDDRLSGPRTFSLDERGRVTAVAGQRWTERYAYDVAGRLADAAWPAPAGEELLGARSVSGAVVTGAGRVRYTYDECGRMISRAYGDSRVWHYTWGPRDRLVAVRVPDGSTWHYTYDALGRRVRKVHVAADGVAVLDRVEFTWDGDVLVEQARTGSGGAEVTVWDYEPESFRPLLQRHGAGRAPQDWVDEQFYAIVADPAGAPAELVNEQGGIEWFARTSLFGVMVDESGGASTPLRFQGQYFDAETGLHYNYHRYYDPALARYLSPDPIGLNGGPDPHAYVENPHAFADPLGLTSQSCRGRSGGNRSPRREQSPGGTTYQAGAPGGRYSSASRRHAAGYDNPSHSHANMLPHWRRAAASPPPRFRNRAEERRWLMDQRRRFRATSPSGRQTGMIQGHSNGVLGHRPSASAHWNSNGMQNTRQSNIQHNRDTNTYHGIEDRGRSNASGASEPRFQDPTPSNGANRIYWDPRTPGYQGGPWPSWSPYNPPGGGAGGGGASSSGGGASSSGGGGGRR